ncbi:hypothetical protein [Deinococcus sp.]|uniref:hypothetical protein n=1 Tax=Deinococcus sp. TaxID=47478 RepID=UPI003C7AE1C5
MYTLIEAQSLPEGLVGAETRRLGRYADLLPAAFVIPSSFEEGFYRHNNLPAQLAALFAAVRPERIDEDALEPLCLRAGALILGSALLDDAVQGFYRALHQAELDSGPVHLRRPGERRVERAQARSPGAEVLHALKRLWADDWSFGAVLERLDVTRSVALEARAVLVLRGGAGQPDAELAARLKVEQAWVNPDGLVGLE